MSAVGGKPMLKSVLNSNRQGKNLITNKPNTKATNEMTSTITINERNDSKNNGDKKLKKSVFGELGTTSIGYNYSRHNKNEIVEKTDHSHNTNENLKKVPIDPKYIQKNKTENTRESNNTPITGSSSLYKKFGNSNATSSSKNLQNFVPPSNEIEIAKRNKKSGHSRGLSEVPNFIMNNPYDKDDDFIETYNAKEGLILNKQQSYKNFDVYVFINLTNKERKP